jgi:GT2 family glycosyltransferase
MSEAPSVTIGVPVYRGELFIEEALRSIQSQTHREFEVIISLDGPQPAAEELCRPFLRDSRFRLVTQPERLGWVGNLNHLMARVETPYWYFHQQDDLVDPRYVEALFEYAERTPEAAVVYCDILAFGDISARFIQPSVTGTASARLLALLYEHHPAVAFRGLTRREALRDSGGIRTNEVENASADTTWMAAIARSGELRRVPLELYRKRYHAENTHLKWAAWPEEKRRRAWIVHCADMLEQAMLVEASVPERRLLWLAAVGRLVSPRTAFGYLNAAALCSSERWALLEAFDEQIRTARLIDLPGWLDDDWKEIRQWTRGFYWLPSERSAAGGSDSLRRKARNLWRRWGSKARA